MQFPERRRKERHKNTLPQATITVLELDDPLPAVGDPCPVDPKQRVAGISAELTTPEAQKRFSEIVRARG